MIWFTIQLALVAIVCGAAFSVLWIGFEALNNRLESKRRISAALAEAEVSRILAISEAENLETSARVRELKAAMDEAEQGLSN